MPQYVITAHDFKDKNALKRRTEARPDHLEKAKELKDKGNFVKSAALLDENQNMNGSVMLMDFESEEELQQWLKSEPYILQKVWDKVDIAEAKIATL
ncbi:YciI family protein [Jiulongibacter sediminis]|uniref:YCII-related domain-containing protein n=1 Tax=Jiulongibacter sediminis TaxID=1605367 RepID=A0A0P7BVA5_9BACT|nr:YciI family protein [Jiulongibacter sediminis]KPM48831.1 hypothetical protein AFM12_09670 [Jiulongibacter sediminis]TBX25362.1 hypothetical protein TK44_09675 [Jiulongibacter sediminis]